MPISLRFPVLGILGLLFCGLFLAGATLARPAPLTDLPPGVPTPTPTICFIQFTDVPPGNPYYQDIRCLACRGIAEGYCDGTYRPQVGLIRATLAQWTASAAGYTEVFTTNTFADVPTGSYYFQYA